MTSHTSYISHSPYSCHVSSICLIFAYISSSPTLSAVGPSWVWEWLRGTRGRLWLWIPGGEYAVGRLFNILQMGSAVWLFVSVCVLFVRPELKVCFHVCGCRSVQGAEGPAVKSAHLPMMLCAAMDSAATAARWICLPNSLQTASLLLPVCGCKLHLQYWLGAKSRNYICVFTFSISGYKNSKNVETQCFVHWHVVDVWWLLWSIVFLFTVRGERRGMSGCCEWLWHPRDLHRRLQSGSEVYGTWKKKSNHHPEHQEH